MAFTDSEAELVPLASQGKSSTGVRAKRRRAVKACDECHRRKVKCDSASMPNNICSNCRSLKVECTHDSEAKKRGPKTGAKRRPPSDVRTLIGTILGAPRQFFIPDDHEFIRDMLIDLALFARNMDSTVNTPGHRSRSGTLKPEPTSTPPPEPRIIEDSPRLLEDVDINHIHNLERITDRLHGLTLDENKVTHASWAKVDSSSASDREKPIPFRKRPEIWTRSPDPWNTEHTPQHSPYIFPTADLLHHLVHTYFTTIHYRYQPLLHRPTFERQVFEEKLHLRDPMFAATLLGLCALASRYSNDPRNLDDGTQTQTQSEHSLGWKYFRQLRFVRTTLVRPQSLFEVQLCALSASFLLHTSEHDAAQAWNTCSAALRVAHDMASNKTRESEMPWRNDKEGLIEREMWKRAFWVLVNIDLSMCLITGRMRTTTDGDYDVDFPIECDDEYWFDESESDTDLLFVQPQGKPSYLAFWSHWLKLVVITTRVARALSSLRKSNPNPNLGDESVQSPQATLDRLTNMLDDWMESAPTHLRWDPHIEDPIFFSQSTLLRSAYYRVQIQINKPHFSLSPESDAIEVPSTDLVHSSMTKCHAAARSYLRLFDVCTQRRDFVVMPHTIVFLCGFVLLTNLCKRTWTTAVMDPELEAAELYRCASFLSAHERRYKLAGRLRDVVAAMLSTSRFSDPSSLPMSTTPESPNSQSSLKRNRSRSPTYHSPGGTLDSEDVFDDFGAVSSGSTSTRSSSLNSQTQSFLSWHPGTDDHVISRHSAPHHRYENVPGHRAIDFHGLGADSASEAPLLPPHNAIRDSVLAMDMGVPMDNLHGSGRPGEDWAAFMTMVDEVLETVTSNPDSLARPAR